VDAAKRATAGRRLQRRRHPVLNSTGQRRPAMSNDENNPAQNPMQPSIQGYRKFDQATSDLINSIKELGKQVEAKLDEAGVHGADPRQLALARTNLQQGAMWLIRSVAQP